MFQKVSQKVSINLSSDSVDFHLQVLSDKRLSYADKCLYNYFFLQTLRNGKIIDVPVNQVVNELNISFPQYYKSRQLLVKRSYIKCLDKDGNVLNGVGSSKISLHLIDFDSELIEGYLHSDNNEEQEDYECDDYDQEEDTGEQPIIKSNQGFENKKKASLTDSNNSEDIMLCASVYDNIERSKYHLERMTLTQFNKLSPKKREVFLRCIGQDQASEAGLLAEYNAIDKSKPIPIWASLDDKPDIDSIPF